MTQHSDWSVTRRDSVLFAGCLVLSLVALLTPSQYSHAFANGVRSTALRPLVWTQQRAEEGRTSRARLEQAFFARDSLALLAMDQALLATENRRLRQLLGVGPRTGTRFVGAEVLHQTVPTDGRTLLLSVGRVDGVEPYDIVLAPEGLLGVVTEVGARSSVANTWAHPEFRVAGVTLDGAVLGVVAPSPASLATNAILEFRGVAYRDTLAFGTMVVSAGLGDVYPRGIPIGRVIGVQQEHLGWERAYALRPAVNPGVVAHVMVIRSGGPAITSLAPDSTTP